VGGRRGRTLHSSSLGKSSIIASSSVLTGNSGGATSSLANRFSSSSCSSSMERFRTSKWSGHSLLKCPGFPQRKQDAVGNVLRRARSMTGLPGDGTRWAFGRERMRRRRKTPAGWLAGVTGVLYVDWKASFVALFSSTVRAASYHL
jgi:hypothetical protein